MSSGAPATLGRYRLLRQLAADEISELSTAVPADDEAETSSAVLVQRFRLSPEQIVSLREPFAHAAERARALDHPCVARVLDYHIAGQDAYVVLQTPSSEARCLGTLIDQQHARDESMPSPEVARIGAAIASALHHVHGQPTPGTNSGESAYGHLVPNAVVLGAGEHVHLLGMSMRVALSTITLLGDRHLAYQSPEQVSGHTVDHRSDLFALGGLLAEMATGQRLFSATNVFELVRRIRDISDESVRQHLGDAVPEPLYSIIRRALRRMPGDRYQRAQDMAQDLTECAERLAHAGAQEYPAVLPADANTVLVLAEPVEARNAPGGMAPGDVIGKYRILHPLGSGGMGQVFLGHDQILDRRIAIKVLSPTLASNQEIVSRFINEARAVARIAHPNIVTVYEVGFWNDRPCMAMEYLEGVSLRGRIGRHARMSAPGVVAIGTQIAQGMTAAHERGILHRDLKPENIMLLTEPGESHPRVKILDFGIAKLYHQSPDDGRTSPGTILGTPAYMSPEQTRDSASVDARSDIYSLGCVFYEMACGVPPFTAASFIDVLMAQVVKPPPDPRELVPDLPDPLAHLILSMLAKDPAERPSTMAAVRTALESLPALPDTNDDEIPADHTGTLSAPIGLHEYTRTHADQDGPVIPIESEARHTGTPEPTFDLRPWLPPTMAGAHAEIRAFLDSLFERYQPVAPQCLRLSGARVEHAESYIFFALFVSALASSLERAPLGQLGTQTFVHSAAALDGQLRDLDPGLKIVIAIADSAELGPGVREKILHYRKQFEAVVVPMYVGELRKAYHDDQLLELFYSRVSDFHTLRDPYLSAGPPDATQFFGMRALVNDLVDRIGQNAPVITITGPPGSGKSSLVAMAEYGLGDHAFVYVRCPATVRQRPLDLVKKIAAALPTPIDPEALDAQPDIDKMFTLMTGAIARASAGRARKRPVLVLEDADWLITALIAPDIPAPQADEVRAMWSSLAEQCHAGGMSLIVTSIRGFWLSRRVLGTWENPLRPYAIDMPHLDHQALNELVRQLGVTINLHFDDAAIRAIQRLSAGNVYTVRALASRIVRNLRERQDHHALAHTKIHKRDVHEAAEQLVSLARVYDETVLPWLDDVERQVLMAIAAEPPSSSRSLQRALGPQLGETRVRDSFTALQNMGLATPRRKPPGSVFSRRRHRVAIPLLARWIRSNLEQSSHQRRDRQRRRLRLLTVGLTLTALLIGAYVVWFQTGRALASSAAGDPCTASVDHPLRASPGDTIRVHVYRRCTRLPARPWSLAAPETPAYIQPYIRSPEATPPDPAQPTERFILCADARLDCREELAIELSDTARDHYDFEIAAGRQVMLGFAVEKDPLATFKRRFELVFQIAALLPLFFSLLLAFHTEVTAAIRRWLRAFKSASDQRAELASTTDDG